MRAKPGLGRRIQVDVVAAEAWNRFVRKDLDRTLARVGGLVV